MIMKKGTIELGEYNHGLEFDKLASDPYEWVKLRRYLKKAKKDMESCIVDGSSPMFGYPTVCYNNVKGIKIDSVSREQYLEELEY